MKHINRLPLALSSCRQHAVLQNVEWECQAAEAGEGVGYLGVGMAAGEEERGVGEEKAVLEVSS